MGRCRGVRRDGSAEPTAVCREGPSMDDANKEPESVTLGNERFRLVETA